MIAPLKPIPRNPEEPPGRFKLGRILPLALVLLSAPRCGEAPTQPATRTPVPTSTPALVPVIAGTWNGTVTCDDGRSGGPITVKLEQPGDGRNVNGSMSLFTCDNCGSSLIYARLVDGLPWSITGTVTYKSTGWCYPYYTGNFAAPLSGSLMGSPVSQISVTTGRFKSTTRNVGRPGVRLELTTRSAP